jgi:hypothetical protein
MRAVAGAEKPRVCHADRYPSNGRVTPWHRDVLLKCSNHCIIVVGGALVSGLQHAMAFAS